METWQPQEMNTDTAQEKQVQKLKREDPEGRATLPPPVLECLISPLPSFSPLSTASFSLSLSLPASVQTHTHTHTCVYVHVHADTGRSQSSVLVVFLKCLWFVTEVKSPAGLEHHRVG